MRTETELMFQIGIDKVVENILDDPDIRVEIEYLLKSKWEDKMDVFMEVYKDVINAEEE